MQCIHLWLWIHFMLYERTARKIEVVFETTTWDVRKSDADDP